MGKKRRIFTNPKKFGSKYFEFLDNLDGTDDNVISSTRVTPTIRTLGLADNGDRTIKVTAQMFGSGSAINDMQILITKTGSVALASPVVSSERPSPNASSRGYLYTSSAPAVLDNSGNIFVLPAGTAQVKCTVYDNGNPGTLNTSTIILEEAITVGSAPIGLTSTMLSGALQGNSGDSWNGSAALSINLDAIIGTGAQHGSGSGVGSSDTYNPKDNQHGYSISVSGAVNGAQTLENSGSLNGHSDSGAIELIAAGDVETLTPETLTVTFTPLDVNDNPSSDEAVTFDITVVD